ncbi:di-heme oxidoreductase family protein [Rhodovibrionaceae bacterium A322]
MPLLTAFHQKAVRFLLPAGNRLIAGLAAAVFAPFALLAIIGGAADATAEKRARSQAEEIRVSRVTALTSDFSKAEGFEDRPGGAATTFKTLNANVFSHGSDNLSFEREFDFKLGNSIFKKIWISSPSVTASSNGLGPLFNARSCQRCHIKDGRGHPPSANYPDDTAVSMFLRLSVPARTPEEKAALAEGLQTVIPEPTYGGQLQDFAVQGHPAEGHMNISYEEKPVTLADGTVVSLRAPTYQVTDLGYGPLDPDVMLSPRVAPPMIGLGLLEAIYDEDILALADPLDQDGDGISGKANQVWSYETGAVRLGRFGLKSGHATVPDQVAGAFAGDIGLSTPLIPTPAGDCTDLQVGCLTAPHGDKELDYEDEVSQEMFDLVVFYSRNLAVPARRDTSDPQVLAGKEVFYESGCASCHRPKFVTRRDSAEPEQSFQLIWPYSDLLLHDLGEGLADHRPEGLADGREWRTAPLWGLGLTKTVNGHTFLLHDGRARSILEAILWHGGEAERAKQAVVSLSTEQRQALLAFLNSL